MDGSLQAIDATCEFDRDMCGPATDALAIMTGERINEPSLPPCFSVLCFFAPAWRQAASILQHCSTMRGTDDD